MAKNKRLMALVEAIKGYDTALDIGTDHGYVLKYALDLGYIKQGIASDIAEKPLALAEQHLKGYPVTCYVSDGFLSVQGSFDVAIIAGIGAYTISHILSNIPEGSFDLIIMAHDHLDDLRAYLRDNHLHIDYEDVIFDKRFYHLMKVSRRIMKISEKEIVTGIRVKPSLSAKRHMFEMYEKKQLYAEKAHGLRAETLKKESQFFLEVFESMTIKEDTR